MPDGPAVNSTRRLNMSNFNSTANNAGHGLNPVAALMNGALHTDTSHTGHGFNPFAAIVDGLLHTGATLYTWQRRANERKALKQLDERLLLDIGMDRLVANDEADKPFWRS
jgi:uncharacterized protein YjiS (DUF1127 family)